MVCCFFFLFFCFFFFNDTATTEIYTLSLHDALPIFMDVGVITALMTLFLSYNCDRLIMPFYSLLALPLGAELPEPRSKQVQRFHTIGCWVFSILMPTRLLGWPLDMFWQTADGIAILYGRWYNIDELSVLGRSVIRCFDGFVDLCMLEQPTAYGKSWVRKDSAGSIPFEPGTSIPPPQRLVAPCQAYR